jgi:hypothetical protein
MDWKSDLTFCRRRGLTAFMRSELVLAALPALLVLVCGCASEKAGTSAAASPPAAHAVSTNVPGAEQDLLVTPDTGLNGKVALANIQLQFVVLSFPLGQMPEAGQRLNVYRHGLKVGEVRVNPKQLDENVIADVVAGEAMIGDAVRDR